MRKANDERLASLVMIKERGRFAPSPCVDRESCTTDRATFNSESVQDTRNSNTSLGPNSIATT